MKYLLFILLLTGCESHPPSVNEVSVQTALPEELKECKRYEIHPTTYHDSDPEIIYRCPNSTTSTTVTIPQGKTTLSKTTVVIDGVTYTKQ